MRLWVFLDWQFWQALVAPPGPIEVGRVQVLLAKNAHEIAGDHPQLRVGSRVGIILDSRVSMRRNIVLMCQHRDCSHPKLFEEASACRDLGLREDQPVELAVPKLTSRFDGGIVQTNFEKRMDCERGNKSWKLLGTKLSIDCVSFIL